MECGRIRSRVAKVSTLSFPKHSTPHGVSLSARGRAGLIPSVENWSWGMAHAVPSSCAVIFVNSSTNSNGSFLHESSSWGFTTSPTKPSSHFTTLWASFGLLGSPTPRWVTTWGGAAPDG